MAKTPAAASPAPATDAAKPAKKKKGGKLGSIFFILLCAVLTVGLKAAFLFVLIGMLPTFAAHLSDTSRNREIYRSVLACNIAGILPQGTELWSSPHHGISSFYALSDPAIWLTVYSFAALGWVLVWVCPHVADMFADMSSKNRLSRLENVQRQLIEEWGNEIEKP